MRRAVLAWLLPLWLGGGLAPRAMAENLLRNPGFEQGETFWFTAGQTWYEQPKGSGVSIGTVDDVVAHAGRCSLRFTGAGNRGIAFQRVECQAGMSYRASAWVKTKGLDTAEAGFDLGLLADEEHWLDGAAPKALTGDQDWTQLTCEFKTPPGTRFLQLHLFTRAANRGVVWFDDAAIEPLLPPLPVTTLKLSAAGAGGLALDWSGYPAASGVKAFRIYRGTQPFTDLAGLTRVAEVPATETRYTVPDGRADFYAVSAVDDQGRENRQVTSLSLRAAAPAQPTPPHYLWSDDLSRGGECQWANRVTTGPGGVRLVRRKSREWFAVSDVAHVRTDGWTQVSCDQPGARLTITFTGRRLTTYGPGTPDMGILELALDGGPPRELDLATGWTLSRGLVLADCPAGGTHTLVVTLTGRKNAQSKSPAGRLDVLEASGEGYVADGQVVSEPIVCPPGGPFRWERLHYAAGTPEGTALTVDVLDGAGQVLLAGAADGADLGALRSPILRLRARLSSRDGGATPVLAYWQVTSEHAASTATVLDAVTGQRLPGATVSRDGDLQAVSAPGYLDRRAAPSAPVVALQPTAELERRLQLWPASELDNVFEDAAPPPSLPPAALALEAAGNEVEAAQLVLRPREDLGRVRVSASALRGPAGTIPAANVRTYFVGYVPVPFNSTEMAAEERARTGPGWYPDPLLTDEERELNAGRCQPVWLSVRVPRDAQPGVYTGALRLETPLGARSVPVQMTVWPFALSDESHLWFGHGGSGWTYVTQQYATSGAPEERWRVIRMALRHRAEHRENMVCIDDPVFSLARVTRTAAGEYRYDFAELDRWLAAIRETYPDGHYLVESMCFAVRDGWFGQEIFFPGCPVYNEQGGMDGAHSVPRVSTDAEQFKAFARPFFAALERHLDEAGVLDRFYTRLHDEPLDASREAYLRLTRFVHDSAPRLKRFESIQTMGLAGNLEIMNPLLDWFDQHYADFQAARKPGWMVWFYTCCTPRGKYPNRQIDYPLLKQRIIPWMSYRLGADGYDRWGWAWWSDDPYDPAQAQLGPGDNFVVYPDPRKRELIPSLRWEMMRKGMEDYEYLWLLGQRSEATAAALGARPGEFDPQQWPRELAARAVTSATVYEREPQRLLALRRELAAAIVAAGASPRCVCQLDGLKLRGLTERGAEVTVNGLPVSVGADGRFAAVLGPPGPVTVTVSQGGARRQFQRGGPAR